jgi:hypothetical protein
MDERISKFNITQASFNTQSPEILIVKSGFVLLTFPKENPLCISMLCVCLFVCLFDLFQPRLNIYSEAIPKISKCRLIVMVDF